MGIYRRWILISVPLACAVSLNAGLVTFTGSGADASALSATVAAFQAGLGGVNNGTAACSPVPCANGFRVINWDAVPDAVAAPNPFAGDFFNGSASPRARGALFTTPGSGFQVSANAGAAPVRFDNINPTYSSQFTTFSPQRLFTAVGSNSLDVFFAVPGLPGQAAFVTGFGVIFTDVDLANTSSVQFFNTSGNPLGTVFAPVFNNGLSFAGGLFNAGEHAARIRITSGNSSLGPNDANGNAVDVVVMDDFIYSEPQAAPEPATLWITAMGVAAFLFARRIQSV